MCHESRWACPRRNWWHPCCMCHESCQLCPRRDWWYLVAMINLCHSQIYLDTNRMTFRLWPRPMLYKISNWLSVTNPKQTIAGKCTDMLCLWCTKWTSNPWKISNWLPASNPKQKIAWRMHLHALPLMHRIDKQPMTRAGRDIEFVTGTCCILPARRKPPGKHTISTIRPWHHQCQ